MRDMYKLATFICVLVMGCAFFSTVYADSIEVDLKRLNLILDKRNFDDEVVESLRWLTEKEYVERVADEISHGRLIFISVFRRSHVVPGVDADNVCLIGEFGRRVINVGDGLVSAEQIKLSKAVDSFAEKYNRLLVAWIVQERGYACENDGN